MARLRERPSNGHRGWTIATYAAHNEALRQAEKRFQKERDRRYTEVNIEKEKALKIKETADLAALSLARDIQIYKDEKANELREQIGSERGLYATKADLTAIAVQFTTELKPLTAFVSTQQGQTKGISLIVGAIAVMGGFALTTVGLVLSVAIYLATH